ncbi:MAG: type II secretion system protein GspL [Vibrio splendidus]
MRPVTLGPKAKKPHAGDWAKVLITDSSRLVEWRQKAGENVRIILPDYFGLPTAKDLWTITIQNKNMIVRLGPNDGFSAPSEMGTKVLEKQVNAPPKAILFLGTNGQGISGFAKTHNIPFVTEIPELSTLKVNLPQILEHGEIALNLLLDPQMARVALRRRVLPWRWPLLLGAFAASLWATATLVETQRTSKEVLEINEQIQTIVRSSFVPDGPILDVRTQVSRALSNMRGSIGNGEDEVTALDLLGRAGGVIAQSGATLELITATGDQTLLIVLRVADFAAADQIAGALREGDLSVEVVGSRVSESASGVRSELRLRDGGTR